jgi:hypothetical protein
VVAFGSSQHPTIQSRLESPPARIRTAWCGQRSLTRGAMPGLATELSACSGTRLQSPDGVLHRDAGVAEQDFRAPCCAETVGCTSSAESVSDAGLSDARAARLPSHPVGPPDGAPTARSVEGFVFGNRIAGNARAFPPMGGPRFRSFYPNGRHED